MARPRAKLTCVLANKKVECGAGISCRPLLYAPGQFFAVCELPTETWNSEKGLDSLATYTTVTCTVKPVKRGQDNWCRCTKRTARTTLGPRVRSGPGPPPPPYLQPVLTTFADNTRLKTTRGSWGTNESTNELL